MNAVDEIQAAIEKLTELRDASTKGPWRISQEGLTHPRGYDIVGDLWFVAIDGEGYQGCIESEANADLIVTLHRTIDAQLHILQETVFQLSGSPVARGFIGNEFNLIMQLVHAINGTN